MPVRAVAAACGLLLGTVVLRPEAFDARLPFAQVETQPLAAQAARVADALAYVGSPLSPADREALRAAAGRPDAPAAIQAILDPHCLLDVHINPESRVKVGPGPARAELVERGWRTFLVKVRNEAGVTAPLRISSPQAQRVFSRGARGFSMDPRPPQTISAADVADRWLDLGSVRQAAARRRALRPRGRVPHPATLLARRRPARSDAGRRRRPGIAGPRLPQRRRRSCSRSSRRSTSPCGSATSTAGRRWRRSSSATRSSASIRRRPSGWHRTSSSIRRSIAPTARPCASPRASTTSRSAAARNTWRSGSGVTVGREPLAATFALARWIDLPARGWYPGDHHIHAAGCLHYETPTKGVEPRDMMRHILGEELNVGWVLTWGPCWYYQRQFFEGRDHPLSTADYLMRYDVEVSGFPSSHAGHLCLLRLKEQDYPGAKSLDDWPTWTCRSCSGPRRRAPSSASRTPAGASRSRTPRSRRSRCRPSTASAPTSTSSTSPTTPSTSSRPSTRRRRGS